METRKQEEGGTRIVDQGGPEPNRMGLTKTFSPVPVSPDRRCLVCRLFSELQVSLRHARDCERRLRDARGGRIRPAKQLSTNCDAIHLSSIALRR